jgi:hypothetical protein
MRVTGRFYTTFNNISVRLGQSVLLVDEIKENHGPAASHLTNFITYNCMWSVSSFFDNLFIYVP